MSPTAARAATPVTLKDGVLRYAVAATERSEAQMTYARGYFTLEDGGLDRPGEGCEEFTGVTQCAHPDGAARVELQGGDVGNVFLLNRLVAATRTLVVGGAGIDLFELGPGADEARGGDGADRFRGGPGDDLLQGGGGDDTFLAGRTDEVLRSGPGADTYDGGTGTDLVDYSDVTARSNGASAGPGITVTLGNDLADDGEPGERDRVLDVERVIGTESADVIVGDNDAELLQPAAGRDVVRAGGGDDEIIADSITTAFVNGSMTYRSGPEPDVVDAGPGDDLIRVVDPARGDPGDLVRCGPGIDTVTGWTASARARTDCERLCPPAAGTCEQMATLAPRATSLRRRSGGVAIPLTCPPAPIAPCRGEVRIERAGRLLARADVSVPRGTQRAVVARPTAVGRKAITGGGRLAVRLEIRDETGARVRHDLVVRPRP